jgi:hypothetical protein
MKNLLGRILIFLGWKLPEDGGPISGELSRSFPVIPQEQIDSINLHYRRSLDDLERSYNDRLRTIEEQYNNEKAAFSRDNFRLYNDWFQELAKLGLHPEDVSGYLRSRSNNGGG